MPKRTETFMVVDDLPPAVDHFVKAQEIDGADAAKVTEAAQELSARLSDAIKNVLPNTYTISAGQMRESVYAGLKKFLEMDPNAHIVSLDKYLPHGLPLQNTVHRLGMTRLAGGMHSPRQGSPGSIDEQFASIDAKVGNAHVILVDDCLASGSTIRRFLERPRDKSGRPWKESVIGIVVGESPLDLSAFDEIPVDIGYLFPDLKDGVVTADLTPFGGRTVDVSDDYRRASSAPYIAPFSDGRFCSLNELPNEEFFQLNRQILDAEIAFFEKIERVLAHPLTLQRWHESGFPVPHAIDPQLHAAAQNPQTQMSALLQTSKHELDAQIGLHGQMRNVITDFDNTLYAYQGGHHYGNSLLSRKHDAAVLTLLQQHFPADEAESKYQEAITSPHTSISLATMLKQTREWCLHEVWKHLDPQECCRLIEENLPALQQIRSETKGELILLTGAPKIWFESALRHIGGDAAVFDRIITTEQYTHKREVFAGLATQLHGPTLAIGDEKGDVVPAQEAGMQGMIIDHRVRSLRYVSRIFTR